MKRPTSSQCCIAVHDILNHMTAHFKLCVFIHKVEWSRGYYTITYDTGGNERKTDVAGDCQNSGISSAVGTFVHHVAKEQMELKIRQYLRDYWEGTKYQKSLNAERDAVWVNTWDQTTKAVRANAAEAYEKMRNEVWREEPEQ